MPKVVVRTFNPFEALYPGRRVVTYDMLLVLKALRKTCEVEVEGSGPLQYLFRKGALTEFLSNPFVTFGTGIIGNLVANAIWEAWKARKPAAVVAAPSVFPNVIVAHSDTGPYFLTDGSKIPEEQVVSVMQKAQEEAKAFALACRESTPFADLPAPLFREHIPRVIGWGKLELLSGSLVARGCRITDDETRRMIIAGQLNGFSIAGIAEESICSICVDDYVLCNHVAGHDYDGKTCTNRLTKSVLAEISLVREPANTDCFLKAIGYAGVMRQQQQSGGGTD